MNLKEIEQKTYKCFFSTILMEVAFFPSVLIACKAAKHSVHQMFYLSNGSDYERKPHFKMGNPKTLTPGPPRTLTTDRVNGLPTDRSTDYPTDPPTHHPQIEIE